MKKIKAFLGLLLITALFLTVPTAATAKEPGRPFNDVIQNSWYYNNVYNAYGNHLFYGITDNTFAPNKEMSRAMLVAVVYRMEGSPAPGADATFTDLRAGAYYQKAVAWATNNAIVSGYEGNIFQPDKAVTREEMAGILYNYAKIILKQNMDNDGDLSSFIDGNSVGEWALPSMKWAVANKIIQGSLDQNNLSLQPQNPSTRAAVASVLTRILKDYKGIAKIDYNATTISDNDILACSNSRQDYWFGKEYDSLNRPAEPLRIQNIYGDSFNVLAIDSTAPKSIYLTFDEGYENGYTPIILDALRDKNVKAVFFVTLEFVEGHPQLIQRMIDEGHVIGNHTCSHPASGMPSLGLTRERNDILRLQNILRSQFHYEMTLFRFPAGMYSNQSLQLVNSLKMKSVFWSFAYGDYDRNSNPPQASSLNLLTSRLHPGAVYLLHAICRTNAAILPAFIDNARAQGYSFELIVNK